MIDLHCHSYVSDGELSPIELVKIAVANGCTMLALTDHDHTGGIVQAREEAMWRGIRFISGVEISVTWNGSTVHIVGLNFDEQNDTLQNLLSRVRRGRIERIRQMAEKLAKQGIEDAFDGTMNLAAANGVAHTFSRFFGSKRTRSHETTSIYQIFRRRQICTRSAPMGGFGRSGLRNYECWRHCGHCAPDALRFFCHTQTPFICRFQSRRRASHRGSQWQLHAKRLLSV